MIRCVDERLTLVGHDRHQCAGISALALVAHGLDDRRFDGHGGDIVTHEVHEDRLSTEDAVTPGDEG